MFRQNIGLKVLSFLISLILWFNVTYPQATNPSELKQFEVDFYNLDTNQFVRVNTNETRYVSVKVQGPQEALNQMQRFQPNQFRAQCSLANAQVGRTLYSVALEPPPELRNAGLVFPNPNPIYVTIEPKISRNPKVTIKAEHLPSGQTVVDNKPDPETVAIKGAAHDLDRVKQVVAAVDFGVKPVDGTYTAPVEALDEKGLRVPDVEIEPAMVSVHADLGAEIDQSTAFVSPTWEGELRHGYSLRDLTIEPAVVKVTGKTEALIRARAIKTEPIDLTGVTSDETIRVRLLSPGKGLTLSNRYVSVKIRVARPPVAPAPAPAPTQPTVTTPFGAPAPTH